MDLHLQPFPVLYPRQDERHTLRRLLRLVQPAELRRRREVWLDQVVVWVVGDVHDPDVLVDVRVVPFLEDLVAAQVGVQDDLPADALDHTVLALVQPDYAETLRTEEVLDALHRPVPHDVAFEPEVLLLAEVDVALDSRVGELVAAARQQIQVRAAQRIPADRRSGPHVRAGLGPAGVGTECRAQGPGRADPRKTLQ